MSEILVELQEHMGSDASIANAAWTSTYDQYRREAKTTDAERVREIVERCVREGHSVPLESVVLRFWCRWPVFVDRQHVTHRMASHNGLSGRYRTLPSDFYAVPDDVREILGRAQGDEDDETHWALYRPIEEYKELCAQAHATYEAWLQGLRQAQGDERITNAEYKRAREALRAVLPTAFMVERTTVINLLSFANYQRLRNSTHAQPEIRRAAQLMLKRVLDADVAPIAVQALAAKGWQVGERNDDWEVAS